MNCKDVGWTTSLGNYDGTSVGIPLTNPYSQFGRNRNSRIESVPKNCYHDSYQNGVVKNMSILLCACGRNGIVFAADRRAVKAVNGRYVVANDSTTKVFQSANMLIGTWDTLEVSVHGRSVSVETIVRKILLSDPQVDKDRFLSLISKEIFQSDTNNGSNYSFVFGCKENDAFVMDEYKVFNKSVCLVNAIRKPEIRSCGCSEFIPGFLNLDENATIQRMRTVCENTVRILIDYGFQLEMSGCVEAFPVGGDADVVYMS